nr:CHASE2 domain-containing protein [Acaryochloris sp. IP29b_bin.148]
MTLQIGQEGDRPSLEIVGSLPKAPEIPKYYREWQIAYSNLGLATRLEAPDTQVTNVASQELYDHCETAAQALQSHLNDWLLDETFRPLRDKWLEQLSTSDCIRVILQTNNLQLQRLPWHQWELLQRYAHAEIVLGAPTYEGKRYQAVSKSKVNILAILGSSQGINTQADQALLENLPDAHVQFLVEPKRQELTDQLWEQHWDILFFAGHSHSSDPCDTGHICLNAQETLNISQLKYALQKAISQGLKLAIFNSCDGLGLAHQLADLQIPAMVVMREPVPDRVAQCFLKYFLTSFSQGQPFHLAVKEARERLHDLEPQFPCATWLPMICQNPAEVSPVWKHLCYGTEAEQTVWKPHNSSVAQFVTIVFTDLVSSTAIKQAMPGANVTDRNQQYFETILQPHRQRVEASLAAFGGCIIKTEGDGFLMSFPGAMQAVQWSVALQQHHETDPIDTPLGPLRIRIGMHTGSPLMDAEDHDYIGQEVDYAYRISDLADGGQILLSEVSAVLLRNAGLIDTSVYSHGYFHLKGIGSVPIFEILWDSRQPQPLRSPASGQAEPSEPLAPSDTAADSRSKAPPLPRPSLRSRIYQFCYQPLLSVLPTSLILTAALMGLRGIGALQPLEFWAFDQLMRRRPVEGPDPRILVVLVKDEDIQAQGPQARRSSLADQTLTKLLTQLEQAQPRAIGLDIYRDFAVDSRYPDLKRQLQRSERLVVPCKHSDTASDPAGIAPPPEVSAPNRIGFTDFVEDGDGVLRRHLLHMSHGSTSPCTAPFSFASLLAFHYLEHQSGQELALNLTEPGQGNPFQLSVQPTTSIDPTVFKHLRAQGGYQGIDPRSMAGLQVMLNYRALNQPMDIAETVTVGQVLAGQVHPRAIKGKVVLVGVQSSSSGDFWSTPYGAGPTQKVAGVFVQAHMLSQIISAVEDERPCLWMWPQWADVLWIWSWAMVGGMLALVFRLTMRLGVTSGLAMGLLVATCLWGLIQGAWIPLIPTLLAFLLTNIIVLLIRAQQINQNHPSYPLSSKS